MSDTYNLRIATTTRGHSYLARVLDDMASLKPSHERTERPTRRTKENASLVPEWLDLIWGYMEDSEDPEEIDHIIATAQELSDSIVEDVYDERGVVFGWDDVAWDTSDPAIEAFLVAFETMDEPARLIQTGDVHECYNVANNALNRGKTLDIDIEPELTISISYAPGIAKKQGS